MIVEEVSQMIGNQIFARDTQVYRVPETEFPLHQIEFLTRDRSVCRERSLFEKDVIPNLSGHLISRDAQGVLTF